MRSVEGLWTGDGKAQVKTVDTKQHLCTPQYSKTKNSNFCSNQPQLITHQIHCQNYRIQSVEQTFCTESTGPTITTTIKYKEKR